jgi:hypothetical protein
MPPPTAPGGIKKKKGGGEITVPEFTMPATAVPGIAGVIVKAWQNDPSLNKILERVTSGPNTGMATPLAGLTSHNGNQCSGTRIQFEAGRDNHGSRAR